MNKLLALRKSKKGFTLVEVIIVLVILAILAAIAIPSLVGYINDAKEKQIVTEARAVYVAAQAVATEEYAKDGVVGTGDITAAKINKLIGEDLADDSNTVVTASEGGKVTGLTYTKGGKTATYSSTGFTVTDTPAED
ncbi:MAG: prepilin-type N-terminal cleavage/methylation protein [Oscillospiraceae bacterium]|jgi:type IV pilus assembly protein PilA|nr:prepilin-type N-terminal cleavage/methylation protein [Oscillospiraceae bacterium]